MAAELIIIDTTKRLGQEARNTVDALRAVIDRVRRVKEVADKAIDVVPNPDDFTLLEAQFGLATGQGETFYNLLAGAYAQVNHTSVRVLLDRCG